jgi:hypothetical protein
MADKTIQEKMDDFGQWLGRTLFKIVTPENVKRVEVKADLDHGGVLGDAYGNYITYKSTVKSTGTVDFAAIAEARKKEIEDRSAARLAQAKAKADQAQAQQRAIPPGGQQQKP